ncbi:hypothetical protein [Rhizobium sp. SL86]|uniref:hypothetical protein n=1 Tax=Rhizobium sp. SL86 TaxID=2995148 RepID=UPI00227624BA|nr:hypothetical protein [Rhizobium sp. SL86]MCY1664818.1 hypothetical protein [Rhizobium sp. SL86]
MTRKQLTVVLLGALVIILAAGSIVFYVQDLPATRDIRVEEPYDRTENLPPGAVTDETSHPALVDGRPAQTDTNVPPRDKHLPPRDTE